MSVDKFKFISPGVQTAEIDNSASPTIGDGVGPLIIGRAKRGPVMTPIKLRSQSEFVEIFGEPVSGTASGDVWREGDILSPMYGAYAAYAYLKNVSPVTYVRLAGWEHPDRTDSFGEAGFKTTYTELSENTVASLAADDTNGGAYGLFVMDKFSTPVSSSFADVTVTATPTAPALTGTNISIVEASSGVVANSILQVKIETAVTSFVYSTDGGSTFTGVAVPFVADTPIQIGTTGLYVTFTGSYTLADTFGVHMQNSDMVLAAKFYCNDGAMALKGDLIGGTTPTDSTSAAGLIDSVGSNYEFDLKVYDSDWNNAGTEDTDAELETIRFNFNRSSSRYIRKVFSTNPTLTNSEITTASNVKSYWLGESYDQFLTDSLTGSTGVGSQVATLLKIESDTDIVGSGADYRFAAQDAESGWVFAQDFSADYTLYNPDSMQKLFKIYSRGDGDWAGKNIKVSFDNIRYSSFSSDPYGKFDVLVRDASDTDKKMKVLETFAQCTLNPNDPNYVARKIGNRYMTWDSTNLRYKPFGRFENRSKFIRLEMDQDVDTGAHNQYCLPWGYYGKPVYANITIDTTAAGTINFTGNHFVRGGNTTTSYLPFATETTPGTLDVDSVEILSTLKDAVVKLRDDSVDGNIINYKKAFWGLYTNRDSSDKFDTSYYDLVRSKSTMANATGGTASGMKFSHKFTLDDTRYYNPGVSGSAIRATYASGNRVAGDSISAGENADGTTSSPTYTRVVDAGYARFTVELYGGFDGRDVKEKDPFRNERLSKNGGSEQLNYAMYSVNTALNIVSDSDLVEFNLLAVNGITNNEVNTKMIDISETRADCFAVIDTEGQYVPSHENNSAETSRVGSVSGAVNAHLANDIDTSYAGAYFNWPQIVDGNNNSALIYMPPSVAAVDTYAMSQRLTEIWMAPAGFTRGNLTSGNTGLNYVDLLFTLNKDDRDELYEANLNPITKRSDGIQVYGNKTLEQSQTVLSRVNVRRMLIYIKKEISKMANTVLFDPNVDVTWNRFTSKVEPFLAGVRTGLGIENYKVTLNRSTTTPDLVDRNIIYGIIKVKPVQVVEYIALDFVITNAGAAFDD